MATKVASKLNARQAAFVAYYLRDWNATRAARRAGYSKRTAGQIGHELLKKPEIIEAIQQKLADLHATSNEVLTRLTAQARGDITSLLNDDGTIDLAYIRKRRLGALIKKAKTTKKIYTPRDEGKEPYTEIYTELELYSAQEALALLGKYHKLFTEPIDVNWRIKLEGMGVNPDQLFTDLVNAAAHRLQTKPE